MLEYVVSGHGGFYQNTVTFQIPPQVTVEFYCPDRLTLLHQASFDVWDGLKGNKPVVKPTDTATAGATIVDYSCWTLQPQFQGWSGVYAVLTASNQLNVDRVSDVDGILETKPLPLSVIIRDLRRKNCKAPMKLHWLCCREIDHGNDPNNYTANMPP
jgi:hypothetical protein